MKPKCGTMYIKVCYGDPLHFLFYNNSLVICLQNTKILLPHHPISHAEEMLSKYLLEWINE